jgi:hypothetical protein
MMNESKIRQELHQMKMFAEMILTKAAKLEEGLSGVVSDKPARKGKVSDKQIAQIRTKRELSRLRKK